MQEYRVVWQQCPHIHHPSRVLFIEAADEVYAETLARDHIERRHGIHWFSIHSVGRARAMPDGSVRE